MCVCNCKCPVLPGEVRAQSDWGGREYYAIRGHSDNWLVVTISEAETSFLSDHKLDDLIAKWPVVYRPKS